MAFRLGQIIAVIGLGCFALVIGLVCVLLMTMPDDTPSPAVDRFDYGPKGNPFIGFGTADHQAPRDLAVSVSSMEAMQTIMGQALANLPMLSSRSKREKTAVETMKAYTFKNLIGPLLVTPDLGSEAPPSTPAVSAQLLVDDSSCLADHETEVFDSGTDGHPSKSATSDRGCAEKFESCYESCLVGFWNRPAPGACHLVCTVMKETCERCTVKDNNADERWIVQRLHSLANSTKSWFSARLTTNAMVWNSWTLWVLWLLQTVGMTFWIVRLKAKLSASEILVEAMANSQEEQIVMAADHEPAGPEVDEEPEDSGNNDEGVGGDQPVAEEADDNEGLVAMGYNFIIGWTNDRLRELDFPPL